MQVCAIQLVIGGQKQSSFQHPRNLGKRSTTIQCNANTNAIKCDANVMQMRYEGANVMHMQWRCDANAMQMRCKCYANAMQYSLRAEKFESDKSCNIYSEP